ncbi:MAG: hypothetical protein KDJ90_07215 [Nitratireductor sp.]|nr:hypothetical protein [Nitratireductor sp.]
MRAPTSARPARNVLFQVFDSGNGQSGYGPFSDIAEPCAMQGTPPAHGFAFDPFSCLPDGLDMSEVDAGRSEITEVLTLSSHRLTCLVAPGSFPACQTTDSIT